MKTAMYRQKMYHGRKAFLVLMWGCVKARSHLGQNLDKFVLITKKFLKFLFAVDQAKCDLLVSTWTKICLWRQILKGAVFLPRSKTFCEQQTKIVFLVIKLPVNSVKLNFFCFTFWLVRHGWRIFNSTECISVYLQLSPGIVASK